MPDPSELATHWGSIVAAIGALGTAACGLVDALKTLPAGGVSYAGFGFVRSAYRRLFGREALDKDPLAGDLATLHGNWINGRPLDDQRAIAKSLVKLRLTTQTAVALAAATSVDGNKLAALAAKMVQGQSMTPEESNALGRFDLELTAILDGAYQRADQAYRNACKGLAMLISIGLAWIGASTLGFDMFDKSWWICILGGLLATPLAPMTKDITSAIAAGVKVAQSARG